MAKIRAGHWIAFAAVLAAASGGAVVPGGWAAVPRGIILFPQGTVQVRFSEAGGWKSISRPVKLGPGQEVKTDADSKAQIVFSDGSKVELSPNAMFAVERTDAQEASFNLKLGKLKAYFAGIFSGRMSIRTPTAVAAVRGTEFEMSAGQNGGTDLDVREGHVEVSDGRGGRAVVGAEETVHFDSHGMGTPRLLSLTDARALPAARPMTVHMESAKDRTRRMIEELRNRELKANEAQLGKDVIDAFGNRVRLEEYILRPANNEFKFLFLSSRQNRFDWGSLDQQFKYPIANDLTQVPAIIDGMFFSPTLPKNWLTYMEIYLTNTVDAVRETISFGDPTSINFGGFVGGIGNLYFPSHISHMQFLSGPGVPGGSRQQFQQDLDYNISAPGQLAFKQYAVTPGSGAGDGTFDGTHPFAAVALNPAQGVSSLTDLCAGNPACALANSPSSTAGFPSGIGKADYLVKTTYADNSVVSAEKLLVSNDGNVLDFSNPNVATFTKPGSYNIEEVVSCSMFRGRDIDVMIAPEIFRQTRQDSTAPDKLTP